MREGAELRAAGKALLDAIQDRTPFDPSCLETRDAEAVAAFAVIFSRIARSYLRLEVEGSEHVTAGPVLYVGNHNGGIFGPDLICTLSTLWGALGPERPLYSLAHDFAMRRIQPLGRVLARIGALRAHPENARRALARNAPVLVYPGGDLDAYRPFWMRNKIVFGRRAGFVRLAQRAGVPIVPIVAQGAHRSALIFHEGEWLARALGLTRWSRIERFPLALALPWGIGAGPWVPYLPLPWKVRLAILPPIAVAADDDAIEVRNMIVTRMQAALDELSARS